MTPTSICRYRLLSVLLFGALLAVPLSSCGGGTVRDSAQRAPNPAHAAKRADRPSHTLRSRYSSGRIRHTRARLSDELAAIAHLNRRQFGRRGSANLAKHRSALRAIARRLYASSRLARVDPRVQSLSPLLTAASTRFRALARARTGTHATRRQLSAAESSLGALAQHAAGLGIGH